jgi:hypothetical protein
MGKIERKSIWAAQAPDSTGPGMEGSNLQVDPHPPAAVPIVEQLRLVEKKERDRSWEKQDGNRTILFRRVPPGLRDAVKKIAESLQVRADDGARAFLEFGLTCYQKGEIQIQPVLSEGRLSLFPTPDNAWGKNPLPGWYEKVWEQQPPVKQNQKNRRPANEQEKPWKWQVSYRGIPMELHTALRELHQEKNVPLGEVAALFLGHSLQAYQNGRLVLNPQPRRAASVTISTKQAYR